VIVRAFSWGSGMRAFLRWAGTTILAVLIAPAGFSARADELLVMPYSCAIVGGQPLLTRAPEQGHRIIGRREQRTFAACSPANPEMCRNWTVHRFDIDCEGSRVSFVDVVAAASAEYGRGEAWSENGRLLVRMPRNWSFAPDDPCARPPGLEDKFLFGRMRRYCNDRGAMAPPVVQMPAGFAPMLGIDAIFVQTSPSSPAMSSAVPPFSTQTAPTAEAPLPPAKAARAEPLPRPEAPPPMRSEVEPQPAAPTARAEVPAQPHAVPQPPAPAAKPAPVQAARPPAAAQLPATPGGPVIPKIINRPDGGDPTGQPENTASGPPQPAPAEAPAKATQVEEAAAQPRSVPVEAAPEKQAPATVGLLSIARSPAAGALAALGGLAIVVAAAFAVARRRERAQPSGGGRAPHDFASASLDSPPRRGPLVPHPGSAHRQARPAAPPPEPPPRPPAYAPQAQAGPPPTLVDRIPQTRAEAIQMLGIGVSSSASDQAMKKIVDGLRLSWHPDLATDEADRQLREFRVKQINAAWDLIQGRRMERLDS
jgi:hypothetical protein